MHGCVHCVRAQCSGATELCCNACQATSHLAALHPCAHPTRTPHRPLAPPPQEYLQWKRRQKAAAGAADEGSEDGGSEASGSEQPQHDGRPLPGRSGHGQGSALPPPGRVPPEAPLVYAPLCEVPAGDGVGSGGSAVARLPLLDPAQVGFSDEGRALTMPTRPEWRVSGVRARGKGGSGLQAHCGGRPVCRHEKCALLVGRHGGVILTAGHMLAPPQAHSPHPPLNTHTHTSPFQGRVGTAEQLHALEERSFAAWMADLRARYPAADEAAAAGAAAGSAAGAVRRGAAVGRLGFFETRLDFWRQLWRSLEMSDAAVMIVDARWVCFV